MEHAPTAAFFALENAATLGSLTGMPAWVADVFSLQPRDRLSRTGVLRGLKGVG
jgi:hypothetical protein